ncbi:peptidoglycan recognition protein family protein [Bacillus sp. FSL K6-3431]|uniref:peptidoglycan recognition protein family protein n=1 Tax=Bacillus sp. FSL K6-3431 TaxID=2921500 RepID=UPI0030F924CF
MKKLGIMVTVFLFYSSLFPYSLLALENIEDGEILTEEIELEVKQEQSMESELESSKEQVIIKDNEEETQSTNEIDAHLNSEYRNQEQSIIKSNGESIPKSTSKDELDVSIKEDSGIQEVPQKENTSNKVEYNELGIKIGTMVHGEDISKLSEEELQYIPIDWRDGKVESEHRGGENVNHRTLMRTYQSFPNVNNYILSRNLGAAKIEYDHKKEFTKFNYRYGFGKVEGVVAHETANNSSTITSEITYMSKNHKNAFVHAFVDHSRIIEIHPTDLGAWGAGRFANQRFVHVELVRVHIFDQFARSINNFSDYIASVLYKYGLVVTSAENTGQGSLWSHAAVSRFLGGTNHVDPHGYFANWGYNWNDFVKLVTMKYNKLAIEKQSTSKLAHVKSSVSRIYSDPTNPYDYSNAGSQNTNEVFYIKEQVNVNGITYYLISRNPSNKSGTIGWMQAKDLNSYKHNGLDKKDKNLILKGTGKAYTKAWGGGEEPRS